MYNLTLPCRRRSAQDDLESKWATTGGDIHGCTFTIRGTGFGTKVNQAPVLFETFSTGVNNQLVKDYNPAWIAYNGDGGILTNSNPRYAGGLSAYNNPVRGEFWTNHRSFTPSDKIYLSYYMRTTGFRFGLDSGVLKWSRITSSAAAGGGGVYNQEGCVSVQSAGDFPGGYIQWTGSDIPNGGLNYLDSDLVVNQWVRLEYEIKLNTIDVADGFTRLNRDNGPSEVFNNIMQRKTGFAKTNYLNDTVLLGLEPVNCRKWFTPTVLTANTTYQVVVEGVTSQWTSGGTIPTAPEVCAGLRTQVLADGATTYVMVSGNEIYIDYGKTSVYDAKFTRTSVFGMQIADVFVDTSLSRIVVGNTSNYNTCTIKDPQPYTSWSNTRITGKLFSPTNTGDKHVFFCDNNGTPSYLGRLMPDGSLSV